MKAKNDEMEELRIQFRMTVEDRDWFKAFSDANCRSMNGQLLAWIRERRLPQSEREQINAHQTA